MRIVIPGEMPDLNQIIDVSKAHWTNYRDLKQLYTNKAIYIANSLPKIEGQAYIEFHWYCKNRMKDPDNISAGGRKMILDGLVKAGVIKNDGWKQIKGFRDEFYLDPKNPRIEVEICTKN